MTPLLVLVTDTNIWVDLENGKLLTDVFHLPYKFLIPDFAVLELIQPNWEVLHTLGLETFELAAQDISMLSELRQKHNNLSMIDLAAYLTAKKVNAILLTGDKRLLELAKANGLSVHGVLWLLDELVHYQTIAPKQAAVALERIRDSGARLPAEECTKRLASWLGE
jgi:hypothetical protein